MLDPKTAIEMVSLKVADLDAQIEFYRQVIGLSVLDEENGRVVLGAGERSLVELIAQPDGQKLNHATGLYHLAIRVPSRADLGAWLVHYSGLDGPYWQGASDHEVSEALPDLGQRPALLVVHAVSFLVVDPFPILLSYPNQGDISRIELSSHAQFLDN